jgi:hypothetical protein
MAARQVFAHELLVLAVRVELMTRGAVEFQLPPAPAGLEQLPDQLRAWAAQVADGREV